VQLVTPSVTLRVQLSALFKTSCPVLMTSTPPQALRRLCPVVARQRPIPLQPVPQRAVPPRVWPPLLTQLQVWLAPCMMRQEMLLIRLLQPVVCCTTPLAT